MVNVVEQYVDGESRVRNNHPCRQSAGMREGVRSVRSRTR